MDLDLDLDLAELSAVPRRGARVPFQLLVVCTGNLCRSPFAAAHLERMIGQRVPRGAIAVDSAGTDVDPLLEMPRPIRDAIAQLGVDPDLHVVTPLTPEAIENADLIVTMTARQRAEVARRLPRAATRTVMLTQLARLCGEAPPEASVRRAVPVDGRAETVAAAESLRAAARAALGRRGLVARGRDDDIADPWRQSDDVYARSIDDIRHFSGAVAEHFVLAARRSAA